MRIIICLGVLRYIEVSGFNFSNNQLTTTLLTVGFVICVIQDLLSFLKGW